MDGREPYLPGVQRTSSAISTSKFDNIGGWMGLEESPHCPFDVVEACRTGDLDTGNGDRGTRFRLPPGLRAIKSATRDGSEQNSGHRHLIEES